MSAVPQIKGWCPGALRPMMSGDGLLVRVRPPGGRLSQAQARGIAQAAQDFGNGTLDISSRANIQIRGVDEGRHVALIDTLRGLGLVDETTQAEARRNVLVTPFADADDDALALALEDRLRVADALHLPEKFGFAIDTGPSPVLQQASADIRLERSAAGALLLCADGCPLGKPVDTEGAVDAAIGLAQHFAAHGGKKDAPRRMAAFCHAGHHLPGGFEVPRQTSSAADAPGIHSQGALVALAFGQIQAKLLAELADHGPLRPTPWRMLLIEGAALPGLPDLITEPDDPLLRVVACVGAPGCAQGLGPTRDLARRLSRQLPPHAHLHVSGCAKGCAHPRPAPLTVVASAGGYDLVRAGRADAQPAQSGLDADQLLHLLNRES